MKKISFMILTGILLLSMVSTLTAANDLITPDIIIPGGIVFVGCMQLPNGMTMIDDINNPGTYHQYQYITRVWNSNHGGQ